MEAILILGAAVWPDGPSPTLRRRTAHAAKLWHSGAAARVIPCGGQGQHPPSEAAAMRALLLETGVPAQAITLEDRSTTTLENIRNAKALLDTPTVILVTDRYHGRRALMTARHFGLTATLSCPEAPRQPARHMVREAFARPAYAIKLRLTHPRGQMK